MLTIAARARVVVGSVLLITAACSTPGDSTAGDLAAKPVGNETAPAQSAERHACDLVTASEMSAILGITVQGEVDEHAADQTGCRYATADGTGPHVDFQVNWGDGRVALQAAGMMGRVEPGIENPYEGIGDEAAAMGPALMVRTGEDLITLTFSGVDDAAAKARTIVDFAKRRM